MMIVTEEQKLQARAFYEEALEGLAESGAQFMMGGGFALYQYTGIERDMKDLDVFCKPSEYPRILKHFASKGFETELTDVRWLAKVFDGPHYIDIIFNTVNNICTVDDTWYEHATECAFGNITVKVLPAEELVWCKIYVQNRERFDGSDVNHILLKWGKKLDWKRLLFRMDPHWHLLLMQILSFQFVYPSEFHEIIPRWLFEELMERAREQYDLPSPTEKVCRGPIIDQTQYQVDIKEWNYKVCTIKTV
ncbi:MULTISPECIES: nucleotidyltransferase [Chitinophagaceae]|uniref:nucleotidyltransferase n=1 Tax=Chitinophagaceae TaxID=563835 RepID=UPI001F003519|nr:MULTISPECIES: nucleotidyltransferase [Chitinophagaceae]